jgi:hypothetical protein
MGDRWGAMVAETTGTSRSNAIAGSHHFRLKIFIASLPFNYDAALVWLTYQEWPIFAEVENWHSSCLSLLDPEIKALESMLQPRSIFRSRSSDWLRSV